MLVRGLDYYTGMVFEWITDSLGAQGTVCGGGRYDNLIAELGGPSTPALGFALGMERLELLSDLCRRFGAGCLRDFAATSAPSATRYPYNTPTRAEFELELHPQFEQIS